MAHLNSDRENIDTLAEVADFEQGGRGESFVATLRDYEQIIDACHHSTILHTEPKCKNNVSDDFGFVVDEPNVAKTLIGKNGSKCLFRKVPIKTVIRLGIELGH